MALLLISLVIVKHGPLPDAEYFSSDCMLLSSSIFHINRFLSAVTPSESSYIVPLYIVCACLNPGVPGTPGLNSG